LSSDTELVFSVRRVLFCRFVGGLIVLSEDEEGVSIDSVRDRDRLREDCCDDDDKRGEEEEEGNCRVEYRRGRDDRDDDTDDDDLSLSFSFLIVDSNIEFGSVN